MNMHKSYVIPCKLKTCKGRNDDSVRLCDTIGDPHLAFNPGERPCTIPLSYVPSGNRVAVAILFQVFSSGQAMPSIALLETIAQQCQNCFKVERIPEVRLLSCASCKSCYYCVSLLVLYVFFFVSHSPSTIFTPPYRARNVRKPIGKLINPDAL